MQLPRTTMLYLWIHEPFPLLGAELVGGAREELGHGVLDLLVGFSGEVYRARHHPQLFVVVPSCLFTGGQDIGCALVILGGDDRSIYTLNL